VENEAATTVEGVKPLGIRSAGRRSFGCPWMIVDLTFKVNLRLEKTRK